MSYWETGKYDEMKSVIETFSKYITCYLTIPVTQTDRAWDYCEWFKFWITVLFEPDNVLH